ncbi:reverse transcriptase [Gossypium australe]|uniref:Reverse transcriptase n=1 Tax=Gossypium australe TaxID=47621 RepID=A0A5B6UV06_9ROSI|nr:reverse transcriptase [Gossypium australe]
MWLLEESCEDEVQYLWNMNKQIKIPDRLYAISKGLRNWALRIRREKNCNINSLKCRLNALYNALPDDENLEEIIKAKLDLNLEIDKTELYWEQRARSNWLKYGDRNTSFFHSLASTKCRLNKIMRIKGEDGSFITDEDEMMKTAVNYFKDLFTSSRQSNDDTVYEGVPSRISSSMNEHLLRDFKVEEINEALREMGLTKAPGYDGFYVVFLQKLRHIIGQDVAKYCLQVLNREISLNEVNFTNIILIPKVSDADMMSLFCPISLCSALYKIISKTIANRLKMVLDQCIDHAQGAFVPGRLIWIIVKGKKGSFALKLDMSKTYNRVEWGFLEGMIEKMGFATKWISLVMHCITSVSYTVSVNGFSSERFSSKGDYAKMGNLKGVKVCRESPTVTHLFFADDSIVFGDANEIGGRVLLDILRRYETVSRQKINLDKSQIFFLQWLGEERRMPFNIFFRLEGLDYYLKEEKKFSLRRSFKQFLLIRCLVSCFQRRFVRSFRVL